jgi:hypothetical protein
VIRAALLLAIAITAAPAADLQFNGIVSRLEAHYGKRKTYIPLMGTVRFFSNVARPAGASGLRLAVFEDVDNRALLSGAATVLPASQPFVRSHSNREAEDTLIYLTNTGRSWKLLIVTVEPHETTVVEFRLGRRAIERWIDSPQHQRHGKRPAEDE